MTALMYVMETLKLEEVTSALLSLEKMKRDDENSVEGVIMAESKTRQGRRKSRERSPNKGTLVQVTCKEKC